MSKKNLSDKNGNLLWLILPFGIVMTFCLSLISGCSSAAGLQAPNNSESILDQTDPGVKGPILEAIIQPFEPSLEMKENVDFLLTPALLVQQTVSNDIVITYPSE